MSCRFIVKSASAARRSRDTLALSSRGNGGRLSIKQGSSEGFICYYNETL
jgi:hypothetical protein